MLEEPDGSLTCLCSSPNDDGRELIECSSSISGCGGWVHPRCFGLSPVEIEEALAAEVYVCPACARISAKRDALRAPPAPAREGKKKPKTKKTKRRRLREDEVDEEKKGEEVASPSRAARATWEMLPPRFRMHIADFLDPLQAFHLLAHVSDAASVPQTQ